MRPIDAEALKPTLKAIIEAETQVYGRGSWGFATRCLSAIEDAPTVEPERKTGKWEMKPDPYGFFDEIPVCSECGCTTRLREVYKFCPNCGASMTDEEGVQE